MFATAEKQAHGARESPKHRERKKLWKKAFDTYRKAADEGSREALFRVGECYKHGTGVGKNFANAFKWFEEAAEKGSPDAQLALADIYMYGTNSDDFYDLAGTDVIKVEFYVAMACKNCADNPGLNVLPSSVEHPRGSLPYMADNGMFRQGMIETCRCGVPKNLQIAKDVLSAILEEWTEKKKGLPPGVAEELDKLVCCAQCGAEGTQKCSLCKMTRYCSKACQELHWTSGDAPHKHARSRTVTPSCKITQADEQSLTSMSPIKVTPVRSAVREAVRATIERNERESVSAAEAAMKQFFIEKGLPHGDGDVEQATWSLREMLTRNPLENMELQARTRASGGILVRDNETGEWEAADAEATALIQGARARRG